MNGPICPECRNGKHVNCTGAAWDDELDQPVSCTCPSPGCADNWGAA